MQLEAQGEKKKSQNSKALPLYTHLYLTHLPSEFSEGRIKTFLTSHRYHLLNAY